ncbi:MAG: DUF3470 domain-containing protein [Oceanospirillaceae bacterium]|nr:DUF3470 domain-containing protein [Oceanospirillaceae bacterium]
MIILRAKGRPDPTPSQEDELPAGQAQFLALNAQLSEVWPIITEVIPPHADADQFNGVVDKLEHLILE